MTAATPLSTARSFARNAVALACLLLLSPLPVTAVAPRLILERQLLLDQFQGWVMDIRWSSDAAFAVAAGRGGVFELRVEPTGYSLERLLPGAAEAGGFWLSSRLGLSERYLVAAAPVFGLTWQGRGTEAKAGQSAFEFIVDLDLHGDQLLVLGAQKSAKGELAPDGAIAWLGSLDRQLSDLRPVHFSMDGPGVSRMNTCGTAELGAVRFLGDRSFVIVPGVENGVFWYSPAGTLLRTWESAAVGLDDACNLSHPVVQRLHDTASMPQLQYSWINTNRVLDDILPFPEGPGLLIRQDAGGQTTWELKRLGRDGRITSSIVPVSGKTGLSHLRGDVRGRRVALLVVEYGRDAPAATPRLMLMELVE